MLTIWIHGCAQPHADNSTNVKIVGGPCEDCKAIFEYGSKKLGSTDRLPDYQVDGPKMEVSGTIYQRDGKTPAADVILYVYHTNQRGIYPTNGDETGWGKRHGYIRVG